MHFTLYIKPSCPYSQAALDFIKSKRHTYTSFDVDQYDGLASVIKDLKHSSHIPRRSQHKTVPIVFGQSGNFIGGYTELTNFLKK
jgi:glutaredoxin